MYYHLNLTSLVFQLYLVHIRFIFTLQKVLSRYCTIKKVKAKNNLTTNPKLLKILLTSAVNTAIYSDNIQ